MPATIQPPYYPIVYIRGYAATMTEIEDTTATPYMGFNLGATKLRQRQNGEAARFIFESPLIRLMKDHGYADSYDSGDFARHPDDAGRGVSSRSVWVFRYYEPVSESLGAGERLTIPYFAADLRAFILQVRRAVCGGDATALADFKVNLVAHSMGGLVARCYLQNICRHGLEWNRAGQGPLELTDDGGDPLVNKVFTYGTPHNGIDMMGINVPDARSIDGLHVRNFNRRYMAESLKLPPPTPDHDRVSSLGGAFDANRFFCFIGTNHRDYEAFFGLSKKGTGPMSDGLVMCANAYVDKAPRAFAYRAHSGHFGIVNSEEGYQNLRRFLFGQTRVDAKLKVDELTLPASLWRHFGLDKARTDAEIKAIRKKIRESLEAAYLIECSARIRGANVTLHERRVDQESAIRSTYRELTAADGKEIYLFSGFLDSALKPPDKRRKTAPVAFQIRLAVKVPLFEIDKRFWFDEHFEGANIYEDTVTFHLRTDGADRPVSYGLEKADGPGVARHRPTLTPASGGRIVVEVPLGFKQGQEKKNPGQMRGRLILEASPSD